jgi:holo-[acyl-carrier protein] synthase
MVIGVGCDIVGHQLTGDLNWATNTSVQNRIFSNKELAIYQANKEISFLAGRFAAKEAVLKCLGTGMQDGISLTEIEVIKNDLGKPILTLSGQVKELSDNKGINNWQISISHCSEHSMAIALAECIPKVSTV